MSNIFNHNSKDMALDRYPYMDNNLKTIGGDISGLNTRVTKIESDIYSEPVMFKFENENISELITINNAFRSYGSIVSATVASYGKFIMLRIAIKFDDYNGWVEYKKYEDPESDTYKQYSFTVGNLNNFLPLIFTSGGSSRFSSQITKGGQISTRFNAPYYNGITTNEENLSFFYLTK